MGLIAVIKERAKAFILGLGLIIIAGLLNRIGLDEALNPWGGITIIITFLFGLTLLFYGLGLEEYLK